MLSINTKRDHAHDILKCWLTGKNPIVLLFQLELVLRVWSTYGRAWNFLPTAAVPIWPFLRAHTPTLQQEDRLHHSSVLSCLTWASSLEPQLDLDKIRFKGFHYYSHNLYHPLVSQMENFVAERDRERESAFRIHLPPPCFSVAKAGPLRGSGGYHGNGL